MSELTLFPVVLQEMVNEELDSDERVLWCAQPQASRFALRSLPIVLFGIPWTAFAVFWMFGAAGFRMPDFSKGVGFFPLFGVPFVLVGLGMLSSPFWMIRKAHRTAYVITERRAILFEGGWGTTVRSFGPERLTDITRREKRDGSGDIILERLVSRSSEGGQSTSEVGFFGVEDVRLIEKARRAIAERGALDLPSFQGLDTAIED